MKKYRQLILLLAVLLLVSVFFTFVVPPAFKEFVKHHVARNAKVLDSVGEYECIGYYSATVFKDYTDYGKYAYTEASFKDNPYFRQVTQNDAELLHVYADDFNRWVELRKDSKEPDDRRLFENYDFDPDCITEDDYFFVCGMYDFYIFDMESSTLYQFQFTM